MSWNSNVCPDRKALQDYFFGELDTANCGMIEEHLYGCDKCIEEARNLSVAVSKIRILRAGKHLNEAWERYGDMLEEFKCADSAMGGVRVFNTRNNKFLVTLRPMEGNQKEALLEIEVLDNSINGSLLLFIDGNKDEIQIDKNRIACTLISINADIGNIIIRYYQ